MQISVWDLPTRLFHWLLVSAVAVCAFTALLLPTPWLKWHFLAGYGLLGLLLFRLVWALLGPEHSRWQGFAPRPAAIAAHLKAILNGRPHRSLGHNPAGGAMVAALLTALSLLALTGLVALGGMFKQGPLAFALTFQGASALKELHEVLAYLLLAMAGLHLAGVLVESRLLKEALILTMITGRKELEPGERAPRPAHRKAAPAAMTVLVLVFGVGFALSRLPPAGWHALTIPESYAKECGACHMAYHPSLLPAEGWSKVMAKLEDHYGEDASLSAAKTAEISAFLTGNAQERWDTLAANRLHGYDAAAERPITGNVWWKRKHRHIAATIFHQRNVISKSNCAACHGDAAQGLFAPQEIHIPKDPS